MNRPDDISTAVWTHFRQPIGAGRPEGAWSRGEGGAVKTGALIELWLRVEDDGIAEARFTAFGCPSTIAAGSWLCQWLPGRAFGEAHRLDGLAIADALELSAGKRGVALVAEDALKAALAGIRTPIAGC